MGPQANRENWLEGWGQILGRNRDKILESFPSCYSQSHLLTVLPPPPPPEQKWFETGLYCKHCIEKPQA
jgi:hypothetical protein